MEESALTDVYSDELLPGYLAICELQCMSITKVMISHTKTPSVQNDVWPSKVH